MITTTHIVTNAQDPAHGGKVLGPIDLGITVVGAVLLLVARVLSGRKDRRPAPTRTSREP